MACFLVPTTEAIVTTVIKKVADKKGSDNIFIKKMGWLNNMLWGGSALLAFEHVWHGDADGGIVNVYIHYLREKLEDCGERVIIASRGRGYSLSEKYAKMFGERRGI